MDPPPVIVEGDWSPDQTRTMKNKLQIYFQSKKKSSGGECRVEAEDGATRAAVYFGSEEVRERVLARPNHQIILQNQTVNLRLTSAASPMNAVNVSDSKSQKSKVEAGNDGASAEKLESESVRSAVAVVLDNVPENMSRDVLSLLVESTSGLDESHYGLEIIWETSRAVITFNRPAEVEKFLAVSQSSQKLQRYGLTAHPLEAADGVRVESLPPTVIKEMLELFFEKNWVLPVSVVMIPMEEAAIVTFKNPKVVQSICVKQDYVMRSIPVKVYPYYESLGTALFGKDRPTWKMPETFTESVHHVVWKFLLMKKLSNSINDKMLPYFCSVDLGSPEVKLGPLPRLLRQKGLTAQHVEKWTSNAKEAFCQLMSEYSAFDCILDTSAWSAAEKDVRSVVREDAVLVPDASRGILTVAGRADDIKHLRAPVENIILEAMSQIKRQTDGISEVMTVPPAMFYILNQEGLQKAARDISLDLKLSFDERAHKLNLSGLPAEVFQAKAWISERKVGMRKKQLNVPPQLLNFLQTVDPMDMLKELFTSKGITAIYTVESNGLLLMGSSESALTAAEAKINSGLTLQTLHVEDQEVLKLHLWVNLNQQLLDAYNSTRKMVDIQIQQESQDKITVAGLQEAVKEVSSCLKEFLENYSRVQQTIRVKSCAVVQFINKKKTQEWSDIAKDNDVQVHFDPERPRITVAGARLHVQKAKCCFQELTSMLSTDSFMVDKPGAKKYFQSQGSFFLSTIMGEFSCVVVLGPDNQEEEEEGNYEEGNGHCYCKVKTTSGVLVSVSKADICSYSVDVVVNAANKELEHIGGLASALLKAAGPALQKISNDYIAQNGKLRVGDAVATGACNLPCKYVVHAVGPRFSDSDRMTSVRDLKRAVKNSLMQAEAVKCSTVALPAISSGVFGFPVDLCADTIAQAVREYCDGRGGAGLLTEIHLVDNNDKTVRVLAAAVNRLFMDLGPTMTVQQPAGGRAAGAAGGYQPGRGQSQSPGGRGGSGFQGDLQGNWGGQSSRRYTSPEGNGGSGRVEQTTAEGLKIVLQRGNIEDQTTDVIINTISEAMKLNQGAVSKAILQAAGPGLQSAVRSEAEATALEYGVVVITDGFRLKCRKVFHAVCPFWDNGAGQAQEELNFIITTCLKQAEKLRMTSLSFPAIGTGNLSFPRDVVARVLLQEIHSFSRQRTPRYLREVVVVVHPSDSQTVDCFTQEFKGQTGSRPIQREAQEFNESPVRNSLSQSRQSSGCFGQVSSPSLGVYQMQMGPLSLQVSSGDITKEACDAIINSSNPEFNLKSGVSKAILDAAGQTVQLECSQIVSAPGFQPSMFIVTSAGLLPSRHIIHVVVGQNDPARIKEVVYGVLKYCEDNQLKSVSFPALGTGQGGAPPSAVADTMVEAVVDFVRKKQPRSVDSVKILIFQTTMMKAFHKSMKLREGEKLEEKSTFAKFRDTFTSLFRVGQEERPSSVPLVLEREEFEPTVFQLCADNDTAVSQAKKRIQELIVAEQAERTIADQYIGKLSQADLDQLKALQRKLTVRIRLDRELEDQEPNIHLEGLTRDVFTAESAVRDIIRKVERSENLKHRALLLSELVEWQFQSHGSAMAPFDIYTNMQLEEALEKKQAGVKIKIKNEKYTADLILQKAVSVYGRKEVKLLRKEVKVDSAALPPHWDDMGVDLLKLFPVTAGSKEYKDVETEVKKTGLTTNIIRVERVQNATLWQSYQLMKKHLEAKNKHANNEMALFHGTRATSIDLINERGFNRSYAGTHGAMIGNGSYFAVDPVYSANGYAAPDANRHKRMYLAKVLVGDFTQGSAGMITPPSKNSTNAADLYDSVVDRIVKPTMFVVFNDMQAYPEYLITFT